MKMTQSFGNMNHWKTWNNIWSSNMSWGIEGATKAYENNRIENARLTFETRSGAASTPIVGGLIANVKSLYNTVTMPIEIILGAVGLSSEPDKTPPPLPKHLKDSKLGKAMMDEYAQTLEIVSLNAQKYNAYAHFNFSEATQLGAKAQYLRNDIQHNIMPGNNAGDTTLLGTATNITAGVLVARKILKDRSIELDSGKFEGNQTSSVAVPTMQSTNPKTPASSSPRN